MDDFQQQIKKLTQGLNNLEPKLANKAIRTTLRAAAKNIAAAERAALPTGDGPGKHGTQKQLVKVRALKRKKGRIGFSAGVAAKDGKGYWAAFVEYGTSHQSAGGQLRRVADTTGEAQLNNAVSKLASEVESLLRQL